MADAAQQDHAMPAEPGVARWSELFSEGRLPLSVVMASGVGLYCMNLYFTAALMPTIVGDIGGAQYYAWVTTGFVLAAVLGSMFVARTLAAYGPRKAYMIAFAMFGAGAAANAVSPSMEMLIAARVAQGLGGGLLSGMGYAVIRSALPPRLWGRATSLTASMWGFGALFGPSLGGMFGELDAWRWAYGAIAVAAVLLILTAGRALPDAHDTPDSIAPLPIASLVTLILAATLISLSSLAPIGWMMILTFFGGVALLGLFIVVDRRVASPILPRATYRSGNTLKWIYLTVGLLAAGVMVENFIPLFAQQLSGLTPLWAGFLGAALSAGWVIAQIFVVSLRSYEQRRIAIRLGPAVLTTGLLAYAVLQTTAPNETVALIAAFILLLCAGSGIGMGFPLLSIAAMGSTDDPVEGRKAGAAIATTQVIAYAITSAVLGGLMALGDGDQMMAARFVLFGMCVITAMGVITAMMATPKVPPNR